MVPQNQQIENVKYSPFI